MLLLRAKLQVLGCGKAELVHKGATPCPTRNPSPPLRWPVPRRAPLQLFLEPGRQQGGCRQQWKACRQSWSSGGLARHLYKLHDSQTQRPATCPLQSSQAPVWQLSTGSVRWPHPASSSVGDSIDKSVKEATLRDKATDLMHFTLQLLTWTRSAKAGRISLWRLRMLRKRVPRPVKDLLSRQKVCAGDTAICCLQLRSIVRRAL